MSAIAIEQNAAPLVAAAVGRSIGVKIYYGSTNIPCTDGESIFLPLLPLELPERASKLLGGFTHHEGMHLRHTDFSVSEIIASVSDARFTHDGRYIVSRDYLTLKIWDVKMEARPVSVVPVHGSFRRR